MGQGTGRENTIQFIPYNSVVSIGNMRISGNFESEETTPMTRQTLAPFHLDPWSLSGLRSSIKSKELESGLGLGLAGFKLVYG